MPDSGCFVASGKQTNCGKWLNLQAEKPQAGSVVQLASRLPTSLQCEHSHQEG